MFKFHHSEFACVHSYSCFVEEDFLVPYMRSFLHLWTGPINWSNVCHWLFFCLDSNRCGVKHVHLSNCHHDFVTWQTRLQARFVRWNPFFRLLLDLRYIAMNPCVVHGYETARNLLRVSVERCLSHVIFLWLPRSSSAVGTLVERPEFMASLILAMPQRN